MITELRYNMDIFTIHPFCALNGFMGLFSIWPLNSYNFTLKNFPGQLLRNELLKIKGVKLEL